LRGGQTTCQLLIFFRFRLKIHFESNNSASFIPSQLKAVSPVLHYFQVRVPSRSYNPSPVPLLLLGYPRFCPSWSVDIFLCLCSLPVKTEVQTVVCNHKINTLALAKTWILASQRDARRTMFPPQHTQGHLEALLTFTKHQLLSSGTLYSSSYQIRPLPSGLLYLSPGKVPIHSCSSYIFPLTPLLL